MDLSIANVINISVATPQTGVGEYNTSNIAIFTRDSYESSFGTDGYKIYLEPTEVATDFGSDSATYLMAVQIFSQQPNILAGNGYLVVIPMLAVAQVAVQTITFGGVATAGAFTLVYGGAGNSGSLAYTASAAAIQTALRLIAGLSSVTVTGDIQDESLVVTFTGVSGAATLLTVTGNTLVDANADTVTVTPATTTVGSAAETLDKAIIRTQGDVQYFGIMASEVTIQSVMLLAAALVQALNKIAFFVSATEADVESGGLLDLLATGSFSHSRGLFYGDDDADAHLGFMASYAGRGLSTNFNGSNTTSTMHLKTISGVQPDPSMTQTLLQKCLDAGVDTYVSIQGVPKTFCSGANTFFDRVYNLSWLVGGLQVAGFNALAQVDTKLPQTEGGMDVLKGAYRQVCEQGVTNQFIAPGSWTSPTMFGNQANMLQNIAQRGYYIYSAPIASQLPAVRAARSAPLVQIAIKEAGAMHSSDVIVNVNP